MKLKFNYSFHIMWVNCYTNYLWNFFSISIPSIPLFSSKKKKKYIFIKSKQHWLWNLLFHYYFFIIFIVSIPNIVLASVVLVVMFYVLKPGWGCWFFRIWKLRLQYSGRKFKLCIPSLKIFMLIKELQPWKNRPLSKISFSILAYF